MFDLWKAYPKRKPKSDGFYLCTIGVSGGEYTMILWYRTNSNQWIDIRRQSMFDAYTVISLQNKEIHTDILCDRTDEVTYWKRRPRAKGKSRR